MFATSFNREMLTLARESRGYTQTKLAAHIGLTPSLISKFEGGVVTPTEENLEKIAAVLDYPTEFFQQTDRIHGLGCSFLYHRQRKTMSVPEQRRLQAILNVLTMQIERLLRSAEMESDICFVPMDPEQFGGPVEIARRIRVAWRIADGPISNAIEAVEDAGGIVVAYPFGNTKASGMSWWLPGLPPLFFINADMSGDHQRLTLMHEVGHVIMHRIPHERIEDEANAFAAEFLAPAKAIKPDLYGMNLERAAGLKAFWKISMQAIIRRAKELGCIREAQYRNLSIQIGAAGYRKHEPMPIPAEKPSLLYDLVRMHTQSHGYDIDDLCRMTLIRNPREFQERYCPTSALRLAN
jgi:Zn-dependent peptidase ImmA (M78 family)/transcriptional regulator with XRE-family HTH domain